MSITTRNYQEGKMLVCFHVYMYKKMFRSLVTKDILECEVKWALGSITMDKASGGDGMPPTSNPKR